MSFNGVLTAIDAIKWWIHVHSDLKVYPGGMMLLGKGAVGRKSIKHSIKLRRSTESGIIVVDNHMPNVLYTLQFLWGQGFKSIKNILYQENQSEIPMEINGKYLCEMKTHHITCGFY